MYMKRLTTLSMVFMTLSILILGEKSWAQSPSGGNPAFDSNYDAPTPVSVNIESFSFFWVSPERANELSGVFDNVVLRKKNSFTDITGFHHNISSTGRTSILVLLVEH